MSPVVKAVSRQQLMDLLVTDADAFTALRYLRHRETVPALPELEERGQETMPGTEGVLCDLYNSLWSLEPSVKDEVSPDRRYWQELLGQTLGSGAYEELHAATQLKELQSVLGTISMAESILEMVPEQDQEQLQELAEAQQEANDLGQQSAEAQANANAAQQLADVAEASGSAQASAFAKASADRQAQAQQAQMDFEQAKQRANELAEALMGQSGSQEAADKQRELARMGQAAVREASKKVEEVSETIEAWGLEPGELYRQGIPEALSLLERMRRNESFQKFAKLLGRVRKIAARKAKSKLSGEGVRITVQETGRDIRRAVPSELVALTNPALRHKALRRWARGELRLHGQQTKHKLGYGPVVVCEDGSGSMEGEKQQWAKATTLALAHYARLQKRSFGWILFDYGVRRSKNYPQGQMAAEQMLELAESRAGGGTDFESPLDKAMEMIQNEGLKKADICFITDGECAVSDKWLADFRTKKKALEVNVIAVLCNVGSSSDSSVREFADRVELISDFTADKAGEVIACLKS